MDSAHCNVDVNVNKNEVFEYEVLIEGKYIKALDVRYVVEKNDSYQLLDRKKNVILLINKQKLNYIKRIDKHEQQDTKSNIDNAKLELARTIVREKNISVLCISNTVEQAMSLYKKELSDDIRNVKFAGFRSTMLDGIRPDVVIYLGKYNKAEEYLTPVLDLISKSKSIIEIRLQLHETGKC